MKKIVALFVVALGLNVSYAQSNFDEDQLGAWYMYFYNAQFGDSEWGIQGDAQYRNWNLFGDLEQLLLRSGVTYTPKGAGVTFTLGYANITTGEFGTDATGTVVENRIYQEALFSQKLGNRFLLTHRLRYEQRWVEAQDFRTRYRYNLFVNVPLNDTKLGKDVIYLALYNELFINGEREITPNRNVELFDRNRTYLGLGYGITDNLRVQAGWMLQTTDNWGKGQTQLSLHHRI
ncbi:MAG: DUF2490 domain-containing protein [Bacteroidota bacterium]